MYTILLTLILACFGAVAWTNRPLAIAVVAATLPTYLLRFDLFHIPLTLLEGLILVLVAVWLIKGEWKLMRNIPTTWLIAAGAMFIVAVIATLTSFDRHAALGILKAYFIEPILLFLVATTTLKTSKEKEDVLLAFVLGAAFVSFLGVLQFITGLGLPIPWDIERRVTGPFPYPNALGLYAGPAVVIAAFRLAQTPPPAKLGEMSPQATEGAKTASPKRFLIWSASCLLCVLGIVLAKSEGAMIGVAATLFLGSLFLPKLRRWTLSVAVVVAILGLAISPIRNAVVKNLTFQNYSGTVRRGQWEETWNMLKAHPIFGAGLSGYPVALVPFHTHTADEIFQYPHTLIFNIWSELGLLGLAAFVYLVWLVVQSVRHVTKSPDKLLSVTVFAALLEMTIHGLADVPYFKNDLSALTWMLLAVLAASTTYAKARAEKT